MFGNQCINVGIAHPLWNIFAYPLVSESVRSEYRAAFAALYNRVVETVKMPGSNKNIFAHYLRAVDLQHVVPSNEFSSPEFNKLVLETNSQRAILPEACLCICINLTAGKVKTSLQRQFHNIIIIHAHQLQCRFLNLFGKRRLLVAAELQYITTNIKLKSIFGSFRQSRRRFLQKIAIVRFINTTSRQRHARLW